jgi:hypothetical protein
VTEQEKRKSWWRREPPTWTQPAAVWLIAALALTGHLTHTKMNFDQGSTGPPETVTWWIVGFWALAASAATFRWLRNRRHPAEPEPELQLSPAQKRQHEVKMWRGLVIVMGGLWTLIALLAREPVPAKLALTGLCVLGTIAGLLIVRAVYRRKPEPELPDTTAEDGET